MDKGILIVVTGGILVVAAIVFSRCHSRARPQRFGQESGNLDEFLVKNKIPGQARNDRGRGCFEDIPFTAFAFLFAGGVSNLLDRILFGCVRDFTLVSWFPAFNFADVFLTIGSILLLINFLFPCHSRENGNPGSNIAL